MVVVGWVALVVVVEIEVVVNGTVDVVKAEVVVGFPGFVVACARTISGIERVRVHVKSTAKSIIGKYEPLSGILFLIYIFSIYVLSVREVVVD